MSPIFKAKVFGIQMRELCIVKYHLTICISKMQISNFMMSELYEHHSETRNYSSFINYRLLGMRQESLRIKILPDSCAIFSQGS